MLSIRIVTAGAVLAFAVSTAAAQDSDTTPGQPGSLLKMLMHSSEAPTSEAKTSPQDKPEAKRVASKPIRTARHFHHHATRVATATEDPAPPTEPAPAPAPTIEQPPTLAPATWSAQDAIDAAPPSMWPAGDAPLFAGVLDSEPQVAAAEPSSRSDRSAATSNAVADTRSTPVVAAAQLDNSDDSRDAWFVEILAALSGALAAGVVAWFLFGAVPQRRYG
jgi:hypothetical protein